MNKTKRCLGPVHPVGGEDVPLEEFTFNKSGPRAGKPLSRCKKCRSLSNSKTFPVSIFMSTLEKIIEEKGLKYLANLLTIDSLRIKSMISGKTTRVQKKTFLVMNRAFSSIPKEKISIGPTNIKTKRNGLNKLSYEERIALRNLVSIAQKNRYMKDKQILKIKF